MTRTVQTTARAIASKKKNGVAKAELKSAADWFPLRELAGWKENPRRNEAAIAPVAESMKLFGFGAPIVARSANHEVIAGHTRLASAASIWRDDPKFVFPGAPGPGFVPVRHVDLSAKQARALAIVDNKSNELADWNEELLSSALVALSPSFDFAKIGFDDVELKLLLEGPKFAPGDQGDQGRLDIQASIVCPHCGKGFKRPAK